MNLKIPSFGNDLIRIFSENWVIVVLIGGGLIMLGLVSCAKAGLM